MEDDSTIKMLGRWMSAVYRFYVKTPRDHLAAVTTLLAGGTSTRSEKQGSYTTLIS